MPPTFTKSAPNAWRLQDAKSQFSALVDIALRGVPQHITRRGKRAVVVLSEQDFEILQRGAANSAGQPASFIEHLLAIPKEPIPKSSESSLGKTRLDLQPRTVDFS